MSNIQRNIVSTAQTRIYATTTLADLRIFIADTQELHGEATVTLTPMPVMDANAYRLTLTHREEA